MLRATLRALAAYKVRLALSALSIILGVAFVAGTFIFTDSLQKAFNDLTSAGQVDLVIEPATTFDAGFGNEGPVRTMPDSLVGEVTDVPGVAEAAGAVVVRNVAVLGPDGKPLGTGGGPGSVGFGEGWIDSADLAEWRLTSGSAPNGPDAVVVDERTSEQAEAPIGGTVTVLLPSGERVTPTVVGIVEPVVLGGGASVVIWPTEVAQQLLTAPGQVTSIRVLAEPDVSQTELQNRVAPLLPEDVESKTGEQVASELTEQLNQALGFLNTFLLVFGLIALFVSAFLIYNTFSILVAQRSRELALMRAIGATRRQVRTSVLIEAILVAVIAATIGLAVGVGVAQGLKGLFALLGAPLPGSGLVLLPRTFAVAYGIGIVVTLVSALVPARRASMVPPVAAMREESTPTAAPLLRRGIVGAVLLTIAVIFAILALRPTDNSTAAAQLLGVSALAAVFAALALAPLAARLLVPVLGWPFSRSTVGRLAVENARRNPRRTAATAGALMIGLALISAMSVIASSTIKSTDAVVDDVIGADYVVFGATFQPFPPVVTETVAAVPGVETVTAVRSAVAQIPGAGDSPTIITIVDPDAITDVLNLSLSNGELARLNDAGSVIVDTTTATDLGLTVGQSLNVLTLTGPAEVKIVGTYEPAGFFQGFVAGNASADLLGAPGQDSAAYITTTPGSDQAEVRAALDAALEPYPTVTLQDQVEFKAQIRESINQLLAFIVALLILAVLIAFLGIVNTLALSVCERTKEIGLLRAVGTTRKQVRRMILIESVLIAVLGSVLGLVLGVLYGIGLQQVLSNEGITELGIDVPQLVLFVVISALGGVVAALWPAWRASRLNVLQAIASE